MRIVDRKTFLAMPAGTVYAKFQPAVFEALSIKGATTADGADWSSQDLIPPPLSGVSDSAFMDSIDRMLEGETSGPLAWHCQCRDGLFDKDQLFAVFELDDVMALIARLTEAVSDQRAAA